MGDLHVVDAGVDPASPFQLKNLEPDTSYLVFGILADASLASATKVSRSVAATGLTKA
ncbi:MAG: hypothetical protein JNM63_02295 [Spirochaetia bacterium]|nr:hypothetical protein [Spirochaetia bacterium]